MAFGSLQSKSPYSYYLDLLGSWPTGIAMSSQWFIYFNFDSLKRNQLFRSFEISLNNLELASQWQLNPNVASMLVDGRIQHSVENLVGCVFAKQVNLPEESIDVSHSGLSYGGYQSPSLASTRSPYNHFKTVLLETNASFLDLIIRPWLISVGYYGLVARPKYSYKYVKADYADVVMLAKAGAYNRMTIRKIYRFYNVAPVSMEGESYSYAEEGLKFSNVSFAYDKYCISDKNSGLFLDVT